jgi:type IV pilus assembly protein PilO
MKRRTVYILVGIALVAVVLVAWFMLISPLRTKIADTTAQVQVQQKNLAAAKVKLAKMEETKLQAEKNQGRLIELYKMVPTQDEIPSLLLQIENLAIESGIKALGMTPSKATSSGSFQVVSVQLQFTGKYFDVNDFVYRLEQLVAQPGRLLAVKDVNLALAAGTRAGVSPELTVTMNVQAFKLVPLASAAASK